MFELHLRQLEARRVREATPLSAAEVALRARELARVQRLLTDAGERHAPVIGRIGAGSRAVHYDTLA